MNIDMQKWLMSECVSKEMKEEIYSFSDNEEEVSARFSGLMPFGTAGLRSKMGAGTTRMNLHTVSHATEALAQMIMEAKGSARGVVIAYDCRTNSRLFAVTAARVLASHNITVYIFDSLRPTPELSFAVLRLGCIAGINITASHNTKEYNGYKVYWEDGAQISPEQADFVSQKMSQTDIFDVQHVDFAEAVSSGVIIIIGKKIDDEYLEAVLSCRIMPETLAEHGDKAQIIYTPLHGTGYSLLPKALSMCGVNNLKIVEAQSAPDGDFPTVVSPNPENPQGFALAFEMAKKHPDCSMILATDPDADRLGAAVKDETGSFQILTGNQIGALLADYIITARREKNALPDNAKAIKSIVSGKLFDSICKKSGVDSVHVLTGFKYIGEKIGEYETTGETFIFGYEESNGYLAGSYARDKDAIGAAVMLTEAAAYHISKGKSLYTRLNELYAAHGFHTERTLNTVIESASPMEQMTAKMKSLRCMTLKELAGKRITAKRDYLAGTIIYPDGTASPTGLPVSDMLYYELEDGSDIIIRPSGTEPKIKTYVLTSGATKELAVSNAEALCAAGLELLKQ